MSVSGWGTRGLRSARRFVTGARGPDDGLRARADAREPIAEIRRRDVEPALARLSDELRELGVVDSLLRTVDTGTVAAANISIGRLASPQRSAIWGPGSLGRLHHPRS